MVGRSILEVDVTDLTIRPVERFEMDEACRIVGLAFAHNPSTLAMARGDQHKAGRMAAEVARVINFGNTFSRLFGAERQGRLVGVLNAVPSPHCHVTVAAKIRAAPSQLRVLGFGVGRAITVAKRRGSHDAREAHLHIGPIAVDPGEQGHGIGSMLLRSVLEEADRTGKPAFLQADDERNVELYEKFGFKVVSQEHILGVNTRFLWRDRP
jgi:ribosomal protein S18 acetylase RimI-like enzyme